MSKKSPVWRITTQSLVDQEVAVHASKNQILIEQDPDMLLVDLEEAKELVGILKSAIDYAEEN